VDVEVRHECAQEELPRGYVTMRMEVSGLRGGHSGIDIHSGRRQCDQAGWLKRCAIWLHTLICALRIARRHRAQRYSAGSICRVRAAC